MICSVKQFSPLTSGSNIVFRPKSQPPVNQSSFIPCLKPQRSTISVQKPLHVSMVGAFGSAKARRGLIKCEAYEADRSKPIEANVELPKPAPAGPSEAAKKVKIGVYFAMWWALNVVFNIYNKKVLNAYPYPWLTSTLSLACGSLIMLVSWATRIAETPKTDLEFWKALFPVSEQFWFFVWLLRK